MTLTELEALADSATLDDYSREIKRLIVLVRLQHEALHFTNINGFCAEESCHKMEEAIAAFEEFEK